MGDMRRLEKNHGEILEHKVLKNQINRAGKDSIKRRCILLHEIWHGPIKESKRLAYIIGDTVVTRLRLKRWFHNANVIRHRRSSKSDIYLE